jgi:rubrerythrin
MPRILTDDVDEHGQYRPRHGDVVDGQARREMAPRGGEDELERMAQEWRCSMCGRDRDGWQTCPICGDHEDMAA